MKKLLILLLATLLILGAVVGSFACNNTGTKTSGIQEYVVPGESMEHTLSDGDKVMVYAVEGELQRGDIVVFDPPNGSSNPYIKRIIGLPGETVEITGGDIYIDGFLLAETSDFSSQIPVPDSYSVTLLEDEYFVLADNRAHSGDSRSFGPVASEDIIGRILGFSSSYSYTLEEVG